ncbi:MAG: hypothetical protein JNK04_01965, partial [Myxococcales bacterium]|nr:hypothetical protein [Myxococcales bacterium]
MRAIWAVAVLGAACASAKDRTHSSATGSAAMAPSSASSVVAVSAIKPPASAGPAEVASAKAGVVETEAATLKRLGGKYLCDQRIYPQGGGGHISAWEWAFEVAPDELAGQLARELPGSE